MMYLKERVVENRLIGHPSQGLYKLILSGQIAKTAKPGQFVHIRVAETSDPLLRRPLSIAGIDKDKEEVTIYYRISGNGTDLLSKVIESKHLSIIGPLGTEFSVPQQGELLLVAGGIGVFPLFSLIQEAIKNHLKIILLWGGENKEFLESADLNKLIKMGIDVELATVNGSLGHKGLVTDILERYLASSHVPELLTQQQLRVAACGPKGMLKAVAQICLSKGVPLEVSLEERMACGVGACLGCVCTVRGEDGTLARKRVCKEGPVLDGKEVAWNEEC